MKKFEFDIFISHASEDKTVARKITENLNDSGVKVWFDENVLRLGDDLREGIENGINNSRFALIILSHNFFKKEWPRNELNGFFSRINEGKKIILPIWHQVTQEEVAKYSPIVANKKALSTDNYEKITTEILELLQSQTPIENTFDKSYIDRWLEYTEFDHNIDLTYLNLELDFAAHIHNWRRIQNISVELATKCFVIIDYEPPMITSTRGYRGSIEGFGNYPDRKPFEEWKSWEAGTKEPSPLSKLGLLKLMTFNSQDFKKISTRVRIWDSAIREWENFCEEGE